MTTDGKGVSIEEALKGLEELKLSTAQSEAGCSNETAVFKKPAEPGSVEVLDDVKPERRFRRSCSFSSRNRRFAPYRMPTHKRSSSCGSGDSETNSRQESKSSTNTTASKEVLAPNVKNATTCTQEAMGMGKNGSGESLDELRQDAAVEELSEYFAHYVGVQSKMSSLAESMYA
ncbi:unnamed protein product [Bursaphelenchus okinawaensis]|uniref:Oxidative stress-responsive protein 1 n=1 Tax=Bursaphelenchus okinawaensis TaxID=465554 RepID=A0A811JTF7_9BILA|nr:unnamed protein product [Bursaphelenchus okinawaensis]CAG9081786.1 unnamed protein product [Bursaphelenchus okinawaensis]